MDVNHYWSICPHAKKAANGGVVEWDFLHSVT